MALPSTINSLTPRGSDDPGNTDEYLRAVKLAIIDVFGLPDNTAISTAILEVVAAGLKVVKLDNAGANPGTLGYLQRYGSTLYWHDGVAARIVNSNSTHTKMGHLWGLQCSNNVTDPTNDIDISEGEAASGYTDSETRRLLTGTALTKRLDATWAAGTNQGGRVAAESIADGTWHVWIFRRSGGTNDYCFSQSDSPTFPDGGEVAYARRIWSFVRRSSAIVKFYQYGNKGYLDTIQMEVDVNHPASVHTDVTSQYTPGIQNGEIGLMIQLDTVSASEVNVIYVSVSPIAQPGTPAYDAAPLGNAYLTPVHVGWSIFHLAELPTTNVWFYRLSTTSADTYVRIAVWYWWDFRGMDVIQT